MNARIKELACNNLLHGRDLIGDEVVGYNYYSFKEDELQKFVESIVDICIGRDPGLLGAIARGWCHQKNAHKTMDSNLAIAIFIEIEKQITEYFGDEK